MSSRTHPHPAAFLSFTLHAHLPYVVNHGTWPHGMEWLHEATAETYLPLLRVLSRLERDGIALHCNLTFSPVLLEQLTHPVFLAEFPRYLSRKIVAAREDEAFFLQSGEVHFAETARFWHRFFTQALEDFLALGGNIVHAFQRFQETGQIDILTCAATHGYLPLLGTDESVRAQLRTAVATHIRHFGTHPKGIWIPECGYRPAGFWSYPVHTPQGTLPAPGFNRIGIEQAVAESGLGFFYVDTHLVEDSEPIASPYELRRGVTPISRQDSEGDDNAETRSVYHPYYAAGAYEGPRGRLAPAIAFPRDPRTALQVWSGDTGYPGDPDYLDFHKKRWPGGHRYWRVTGAGIDMGSKEPYYPQDAEERIQSHAAHFVHLVRTALAPHLNDARPPILTAPFDAELFGHWWFEGPLWLEAVARMIHEHAADIELISSSAYLDQFPPTSSLALDEGSWGAEGNNQVWLNPETSWTWSELYPAELYLRELCSSDAWSKSELATRITRQLCRELLLLEASDWQFLITTGAARDYAELRFRTHLDQFNELKAIWQACEATGQLSADQHETLDAIQSRDGLFPDIDPTLWSRDAKALGI